jgi:hypothetical protein
MENFDFHTVTSGKVIEYLINHKFELTEEDKSFLRITINKSSSSAWEEGKHSNGCDCGQLSCPICCP